MSIASEKKGLFVSQNFGSKTNTTFCGVFDGHGPHGHLIAKKVRDSLPLKLNSQWELSSSIRDGHSDVKSGAIGSLNSKVTAIVPGLEYGSKHTDILMTLKDSFLKAFKVMDKELKLHPRIDCYCSGTTAVTLVKQVLRFTLQLYLFLSSEIFCKHVLTLRNCLQGQDLIVANTGDSRAILGTRDEDGSLIPFQLTVDFKPNLPSIYLSLSQ